jgi:predicted TIM-barrel fold metal-dependent hydrolase
VTVAGIHELAVIDNHCHPYRAEELAAFPSEDFDARLTLRGTMAIFERDLYRRPVDEHQWAAAKTFTQTTIFQRSVVRWLADHLNCAPTREAVVQARTEAIEADGSSYAASLLRSERIEAVLEAGRPLPPVVRREEFEAAIGTRVYSVARTDSWIREYQTGSFDDLVNGVDAAAEHAAADSECVAFKSLIAYRSGLDVEDPDSASAAEAFKRWKAVGYPEDRPLSKPVYDFLFRRLVRVAARNDRPMHVHCAATTPWLTESHPFMLWRVIEANPDVAFVLIHGGQPWILETATMAARLPNVWVDVSSTVPWGWSLADWAFEMYLGHLSWTQVLYGSDAPGYDPESLWLSARLARAALGRVIARLIERGDVTREEATEICRCILGENCRSLHGLAA